jgi:hypothetical protein
LKTILRVLGSDAFLHSLDAKRTSGTALKTVRGGKRQNFL